MDGNKLMFECMFNLKNKVSIVTGGSSGIGLAIAQALANAGAKVAIINRTATVGQKVAEKLRNEGGYVKAFSADVTKKEQVEAMVDSVEAKLGPIDILVNSAGINIRKKTVDFELDEWQQIIDINLTGTFLTCQTVGRKMVARRAGRIVNISSIASKIGLEDRAAYCASKAGVSQLTKVLAIEWAPYGVTVNAVGPGFTRTPLISALMKDSGFQEKVRALVPLQRVGEPEDLLGIVLVLCSDAGAYITGQTIYIDGGWSVC